VRETIARNGSPALMRRINAARVLREIRKSGPVSRADLTRMTGLSAPTVTNVVQYLWDCGHVRPLTTEQARPDGRRPTLYEFCADLHSVLGVDIGADKLMIVLADLDGQVLGKRRRDTSRLRKLGPDELLKLVRETAVELMAEHDVADGDLLAIGVGTPGVVSAGGVVTIAPQLDGWEGLDLRARLAELFGCRVHVEREVILSLLAEQWVGVAQNLDDALFIQLGIGVGAALLLNGNAYRGADGSAGEIGLMPLFGQTSAARSAAAISQTAPRGGGHSRLIAGYGPFESVTGGAALAREGAAASRTASGAAMLAIAGGDGAEISAAVVFEAAAAGDRAASMIVNEALTMLAQGIASLVCALNPRAVILSGGMSRADDQVLRRPLEAKVAALVPFPPEFLTSTVGEEAVALGAIRRVTQTLEQDLILPDLQEAR
jgi:predicted NBD/HSP70 family sugar kinase